MESMKKVKDFVLGETAIDMGRPWIIEKIIKHPTTGQIAFIDTANNWHGFYEAEEFLGFEKVDDDAN